MRLLLLGYVVLAVAGAAILEYRAQTRSEFQCAPLAIICSAAAPTVHYRAARQLRPNDRVRAIDVVEPPGLPVTLRIYLPDRTALIGTYVAYEIAAGEPIVLATLRRRPVVPSVPGRRIVALPLTAQPELVDLLDVGQRVDACADKECPVRDGLVRAVQCVDRAGKSCVVLVEMSPEDEAALGRFPTKREVKLVSGFSERW